jgi:uncharacterized damage-inducible protein DinB
LLHTIHLAKPNTQSMEIPSSVSTRLHYQHKTIVDIIDGLTDEQLRRPVTPGKWSLFETVVHLQTYQHVFISRVKEILTGSNPSFSRYSAEGDPLFLDNCCKATREIMQDLLTTRKEITAEMLAFPGRDFEKKGTHPAFGTMNLLQWMNFFLLHEAHHLFAMFKQAAELKKQN